MMKNKENRYTIGILAKKAQVNIQTIRFYERIKILFPKTRKDSKRIRYYDENSLETLIFIKNSQQLGFQLDEIRELLKLRASGDKCEDVRNLAMKKLDSIQEKILKLQLIESELNFLIADCSFKKDEADCPILDKLVKCPKCSE